MRGTKIQGFVVGELLGSGRTGLLYHAMNEATRQRAIVRVVHNGTDRVDTELFVQEATQYLPQGDGQQLIEATLEDGAVVHLVVTQARLVSAPVDAGSDSAPRNSPGLVAAVVIASILVGVIFGAILIRDLLPRPGDPAPVPTPVEGSRSRPPQQAPTPEPAVDQPEPEPGPEAAVTTETASAMEVPLRPSPAHAERIPPVGSTSHCVPDAHWKKVVGDELAHIDSLAAADEALEVHYRQVRGPLSKYVDARSAADCVAVEAALGRLHSWMNGRSQAGDSALKTGAKRPCEPTEAWREKTRRSLGEVGQLVAARGENAVLRNYPLIEAKLSRAIDSAVTQEACTAVERQLDDVLRKSKQ